MRLPAGLTWRHVFAVGLVLRLALLLPSFATLGLSLVFALALNLLIATGVLVGNRLALAIGIYGAAIGMAGFVLAFSMPNPALWIAIGTISVALTFAGIKAWRVVPAVPPA